jgi:hypothetical protein
MCLKCVQGPLLHYVLLSWLQFSAYAHVLQFAVQGSVLANLLLLLLLLVVVVVVAVLADFRVQWVLVA